MPAANNIGKKSCNSLKIPRAWPTRDFSTSSKHPKKPGRRNFWHGMLVHAINFTAKNFFTTRIDRYITCFLVSAYTFTLFLREKMYDCMCDLTVVLTYLSIYKNVLVKCYIHFHITVKKRGRLEKESSNTHIISIIRYVLQEEDKDIEFFMESLHLRLHLLPENNSRICSETHEILTIIGFCWGTGKVWPCWQASRSRQTYAEKCQRKRQVSV